MMNTGGFGATAGHIRGRELRHFGGGSAAETS